MATAKVINSTCRICTVGCGILIHTDDGQVIKVEGDPASPINQGVLCPKGLASVEYLYHPDRLRQPLKRRGKRGEGKWQPISWDEALDAVTGELIRVKDRYGAPSVVFIRGSFKGSYQEEFLGRLANLYGSPNIVSTSHMCHVPRHYASVLTYGFWAMPDFDYPPASIVVWGANLAETRHNAYLRLVEAAQHGAKIMVIDPRKIKGVDRADLWLKPRPGSDLALALAMINVIINEDLFDADFVANWTTGFDQLREHVQDYPPQKVAEITWIDAETIKEAARFYATNKPGVIIWGNALDHTLNSFQAARAVCILRAITGNVGRPGGDQRWGQLPVLRHGSPELNLPEKISPEVRQLRIAQEEEMLPIFFTALPSGILRAIQSGEPYPVRAAYVQGCNPLLIYSNAREVYSALMELDFLAVADMFMTPTAALADIVLPAATYLECDGIVTPPDDSAALVQQQVTRAGECRSDYEIVRDLAVRLGLGEHFWDTEQQCLDFIMAASGLSFNEFRKIGVLAGSKQYRFYQSQGFSTPSGKVELYSSQLKEWGFDPLPIYYEPPETPYSAPELAREYPLLLTTWKSAQYRHSEGRQIASLRQSHPDPTVYIHTQTAAELGIVDDDWVYIETRRGRITQRARLTADIDSRLVVADYGWWFPEDGPDELYGWAKSNVNVLTDDQPPSSREIGSPNLRGMVCRVVKA